MGGEDLDHLTAADLMTGEVITVDADMSLQDAVRTMVTRRIRHLPVIRDGEVFAMLSDRDVRLMVTDLIDPAERRRYMVSTPVTAHASSPVTTAAPDTPAPELARELVESRIGCLPVVDADGRLIGIVTQTDLLNWIARLTEPPAPA